jgi:hypothetical protein
MQSVDSSKSKVHLKDKKNKVTYLKSEEEGFTGEPETWFDEAQF